MNIYNKIATLFVLVLILSGVRCPAQGLNTVNVKTNSLSYFFRTWNVAVDVPVGKRISTQATFTKLNMVTFIDTEIDGFILTADFKYYLISKTKKNRLITTYISPYLKFEDLFFENEFDERALKTLGGGLMIGKHIEPKRQDWFILDLFIGPNYIPKNMKVIKDNGNPDFPIPTTLYSLGLRFGIMLGLKL